MSEDMKLTPGEEEANKDTPENNSANNAEAPEEVKPQEETNGSSSEETVVPAADAESADEAETASAPENDEPSEPAAETPATDAAEIVEAEASPEEAEPVEESAASEEATETPAAEVESTDTPAAEVEEAETPVAEASEEAPASPEADTIDTPAAEAPSESTSDKSNDSPAPEEIPSKEIEIEGNAPELELTRENPIVTAPDVVLAHEIPDEAEPAPKPEAIAADESAEAPQTEAKEASVEETTPEAKEENTEADTQAATEEAGDTSEKEEEPEEEIDYSKHSREELAEVVDELSKQDDFKRSDAILSKVLPLFKAMARGRRQEALEKFLADGGAQDDFEYRHDEVFNRFDASVRLIRDRRASFYKEREARKDENYKKKLEILDRLRDLIDGENATTNLSPIKTLQEEWKAVGAVPAQHNRTLWANYNALLDRFYNNRNILFELKELDRKKNLVKKTELCEKAEALDKLENIKDAIIQLNELHEEYKKIGAVPRDVQEALWQRFKTASDAIYKKRKSYLDDLKGELQQNLEKKRVLAEELSPYLNFDSDRINDWNAKTKEILAIQKKWDALGGLPREYAKEVNKAFWGAFKGFFSKKNAFFKKLEGMRHENLKKKEELVAKAEELATSNEWDKTSEALKGLQRKWKEIGPVPEKQRNSVYAKFKEACDTFFNNKRTSQDKAEEQYVENQKHKEDLIDEVGKRAAAGDGKADELDDIMTRWNAIGFVPRSAIKSIESKFAKALDAFVKSLEVDDEEREALVMKAELNSLKKGPNSDRRLNKKESDLRRKVKETEDNIAQMTNNLAFFANSKGADKLREEYDQKIAAAAEELAQLKKQLRMVRSM